MSGKGTTNTERIKHLEDEFAEIKTAIRNVTNDMASVNSRMDLLDVSIGKLQEEGSANHVELIDKLNSLATEKVGNQSADAAGLMEVKQKKTSDSTKEKGIHMACSDAMGKEKSSENHAEDSSVATAVAAKLSVSDRMKIWQRKMDHNKVLSVGDFNFPAAKQDFLRLHKKFGLSDDIERELSMLAFDKAALKIANGVSRENPAVSAVELWELFEACLFNETQRKSQHSSFLSLKWNERNETVDKFGERVHVLGTSLGYGMDLIQATFIKGLPQRLQTYAFTTQGGFDELVSAMMHVAETQKQAEKFREINEEGRKVVAKVVDSSKPNRADKADRYANMKCFTCGEFGHVSWQKEKCPGFPKKDGNGDNASGKAGGEKPGSQN